MRNKINEQVQGIASAGNGVIGEGDIQDVLEAIKVVQANGGKGSISLSLDDSGLENIDVYVGKKKQHVLVSKDSARRQRLILQPVEGD